jgi:EAL domain-containing protein (putative c-di-GMP-specific phosphodiesterase class I)
MNLSVQETMLDEATQSFNKRSFIKQLEQNKPNILSCIKIFNLEILNENYSDEEIDNILYNLTKNISLIFKQNGLDKIILGRYYGSEFLIGLDSDNHKYIEEILKLIIEENRDINNIELDLRFAMIKNTNQDFSLMVSSLENIFKSNAKEREKIQDSKELSKTEEDIILAIKNSNLSLSFRPLYNMKKNKIDIYEIAVKLTSSNGDILPRVFLPIINRLGLGRKYDLILIKHIIDLLPFIDDDTSFSFNISPFSLRDVDFQNSLFEYIKEKNINPSQMIIQLYERKAHHDLSGYLKTLTKFRLNGIKICIDNFGSSNSSMEYLKHFKFDMVQFDRDYVTQLDDKTTYSMLNSLISMSKDLDIVTVAKWVDNDNQKEILKKLDIDYIQGFGVSKPINENDLIDRYAK